MIRVTLLALLMATIIGCSVPTKRWPNKNREVVWTAMVAAAKTPDYSSNDSRKRWIVIENNVDINPELGRLVVRRRLSRSLKLPRQNEQTDYRDWIFVIQLLPIATESSSDVPTVTFDVPETQLVPARMQDEATRYFLQVDELLSP